MPVTSKIILSVFAASLAFATPSFANSGLAKEKEINDKLFVFAMANEIRKACDDISPRMFRALSFRNNLYSQARGKGYTDAQIDAYIDDKREQAKMKRRGNRYLAQFGASLEDKASLCSVGRSEIAKRSQIGYLLIAR